MTFPFVGHQILQNNGVLELLGKYWDVTETPSPDAKPSPTETVGEGDPGNLPGGMWVRSYNF